MQCCRSGMIYSRSGSSFEFSEFRIYAVRIRIQPILFKFFGSFEKHLKFNKKEESLSAIFYFILQS